MAISSRCRTWLLPASAFAFLVATQVVLAAPPDREKDTKEDKSKNAEPLLLVSDPIAAELLAEAEKAILKKDWSKALPLLHSLLDFEEAPFVQVKRKAPDGGETVAYVAVQAETDRLLRSLQAQELAQYQNLYGGRAEVLLKKARTDGDVHLLAEVARRYLHTKSGMEAVRLLGVYHLDRGRSFHAAQYFERWLEQSRREPLSPPTLFHAALAFARVGDKARTERVWKTLEANVGKDGLIIGGRVLDREQIRKEIDRAGQDRGENPAWLMYRGNASRSEQGLGGPAFLEARWTFSTLPPDDGKGTRKWVDETLLRPSVHHMESRSQPILPAFFPIAAADRMIYRTYDGIYARHFKAWSVENGRGVKVHYQPGDIAWIQYADGSLASMGQEFGNRQYLMDNRNGMAWFGTYLNFGPHSIFFDNSVTGTLSSDGQTVYAIDDLVVPPPPQFLQQWGGFNGGQPNLGPFHQSFNHSKLQAYDLQVGKLMWELGGRDARAGKFRDAFFLAPPLPVAGQLYVLTERNAELNLVCLDTPKVPKEQPKIAWVRKLATFRDKLPGDVGRRIHAAHLAYSDGILVCPTNAGMVVGVDLLHRQPVWAHSYRELDVLPNQPQPRVVFNRFGQPIPPVSMNPNWRTAAPVIQDGKVVVAAPDAESIHCLNLRDGRLLWKEKRSNDDLYLAGVFNGKVVIVGKTSCRALQLADGKPQWTIITGLPSGQGASSDNIYYLPLKAAAETREPAVIGIDVAKGVIQSRTNSRKKEVPGNLVFSNGQLLSQTVDAIVVYPLLKTKLGQMNERLKANPKDPIGLSERGGLRLEKGDLPGAIDDLRAALANDPPAEVRTRVRATLFEALTEFLQRDFRAGEKYLDDFRDLTKVDDADERLRRQALLLFLVGKGREQQGRLIEAFQAYLDFGTLLGNREMVSVPDEPGLKARPDVWARGRITALLVKANADQRKSLEAAIHKRWQAVQASDKLADLRGFVAVFGSSGLPGRQARLKLAERLIEEENADGMREAQLHLLQLRGQSHDPQLAGQAVEALARLMTRKGLLENAAYYYRQLRRDFAKVIIRDGKTGADLFDEIATDKRFLPILEEAKQSWHGKFRAEEKTVQSPMQSYLAFEGEGELLPFFERHRLAVDMTQPHPLTVVDRFTNTEYWRSDSLWNNPNLPLSKLLLDSESNVRHTYHAMGHLAILNLGYKVYAFDPIDKKKLWEFNLHGSEMALGPNTRITPDSNGWQLIFQDGFTQKLGQTGPITASSVCVQTRTGLVALDPLRGNILWSRSDVSLRAHVFGDEQQVYLVDMAADGTVNRTRAFRADDGVSVTVPRFTEWYPNRLRVLGRNLLVRETDAQKNRLVLRLYDVAGGQDLWKQDFPANSLVIRCEDPNLAGVIEPNGVVKVTDLRSRQEVLKTTIDHKEHMEKVNDAYLISDRDKFYLALNRPIDPQLAPLGIPQKNVANGMRSVPVNGPFYAFHRESGKVAWYDSTANQMLVLDQFQDLPMVLFTARYQKHLIPRNLPRWIPVVAVKCIDKRIGKRLFDSPEMPSSYQLFHALNIDNPKRTIELVSANFRIRFYMEADENGK